MQREHVLDTALGLLEQQGLATATLEMLAEKLDVQPGDLKRFWPDREALLYDCLRYHGQQIDTWRRQLLLDENLSPQQKLLARYDVLAEYVQQDRYPGCLFIAACSFFPETDHPIHQLAEQQKLTSLELTRELLRDMDADDADMVAQQMELIQEGCLSKLLVKRQLQDVSVAKRLAEDILQVAQCRRNGALS
ncbi:TetR family transcriptional regulator [Serratia marcescens]|uniref:Transcriptional regulator n=4 Tax=Serratia TaxID=613 RepID=A0A9X9C3S8_9GAMM|nr:MULTISPECIES: transcriptional regulator [Serratia]KAB5493548.1 transcriptional regulator [Enterobacter sp. RJAL6]MBE4974571.1 transcriptional regulator [Serratia sp. X3]MCC7582205.1 transcriptional regulator [Serratia sp. Lou2A]MCC7661718.1 transcriptional regulator [Serratia sp. Pon4B]MCI2403612.1 transcriptional regulator [Serratia sp. PGPR-27]MTD07908.1 transcriptional regulator [Serratia sp. YC16]